MEPKHEATGDEVGTQAIRAENSQLKPEASGSWNLNGGAARMRTSGAGQVILKCTNCLLVGDNHLLPDQSSAAQHS